MTEGTKKCPYCGSDIPINVKKCKYCGEWLVTQEKDKPQKYYNFLGYMGILTEILEALAFILFIPIAIGLDMGIGGYIVGYIIIAICVFIGVYVYFLPTLIADYKRTKHTFKIFLINLLLGGTGVVWLACLIWALYLPNLSENEENIEDNIKNTEQAIQNNDDKEKDIESSIQTTKSEDISVETKRCPYCAELIPIDSTFCTICETSLTQNFSDKVHQIEYSNLTKQLNNEEIPNDIKHWNWGAFLLTWIWGIGNKSYKTFWVFVPYLGNLIWPFVCGAKGNEWAWKNKQWTSIEDFQNTQKKWAIIGSWVISFIALLTILCLILAALPEEKLSTLFDSNKNPKIQKAIEEYKEEVIKETANNVGVSQKCIENYFDNNELNKCSTEEKHLIKKYNDKVINENQNDDEYIDPIYTNDSMPKSLVLNGVSIMCFEKANIGDNSKCSNSELEKIKSFFKNPDDIDWEKEDVVDYPIYPDIFIDVKKTQQQEGNSNQQSKEQQGVVQSKKQQVQSQTKVITPQANSTQIQQKKTQKIVQPQKQIIQQVSTQINKPIQVQQKSTDIDDFMN